MGCKTVQMSCYVVTCRVLVVVSRPIFHIQLRFSAKTLVCQLELVVVTFETGWTHTATMMHCFKVSLSQREYEAYCCCSTHPDVVNFVTTGEEAVSLSL